MKNFLDKNNLEDNKINEFKDKIKYSCPKILKFKDILVEFNLFYKENETIVKYFNPNFQLQEELLTNDGVNYFKIKMQNTMKKFSLNEEKCNLYWSIFDEGLEKTITSSDPNLLIENKENSLSHENREIEKQFEVVITNSPIKNHNGNIHNSNIKLNNSSEKMNTTIESYFSKKEDSNLICQKKEIIEIGIDTIKKEQITELQLSEKKNKTLSDKEKIANKTKTKYKKKIVEESIIKPHVSKLNELPKKSNLYYFTE